MKSSPINVEEITKDRKRRNITLGGKARLKQAGTAMAKTVSPIHPTKLTKEVKKRNTHSSFPQLGGRVSGYDVGRIKEIILIETYHNQDKAKKNNEAMTNFTAE